MGKKLAIKGHATRGEEVIELLEMLSGKDSSAFRCTNSNLIYFVLDNHVHWDYIGPEEIDKYEIFTLEEFLEKFPFKVGDKVKDCYGNPVTIKSMKWSEDCENMVYDFKDSVIVLAAEDLLKSNAEFLVNKEKSEEVGKMLCNMTLNHLHGNHLKNVLSELYEHIKTTPKEDLEREFEEIKEWSNVGPTVEEFMTFCECVNKKPVYPKTYKECCDVLGIDTIDNDAKGYKHFLVIQFQELLIARDAYWRIAGEQMGLGKPWKPDWNWREYKFCIGIIYDEIEKFHAGSQNRMLSFPTEEMRDAFYENFKDLIESCKELL